MANSVTKRNCPVYGQANPPLANREHPFPFDVDPVMEGRKGSLYILGTPDVQSRPFVLLAEHYYANNDFDFLPTLRAAFAHTYRHRDEYEGRVLLAVVVHELNLYAVSAQDAEVYLARSGTVSRPLQEYEIKTTLNIGTDESGEPITLQVRSTKARLYNGDCLAMGSNRAAVLTKKVLRQSVRHSQDPNDIAARLAHAAARSIRAQLPFGVILFPGLSPIAASAFAPKPQYESDASAIPAAMPPPREGISPVWLALVVAIVAIGATLWMVKPDISMAELRDRLVSRLTPTPTLPSEGYPEASVPAWLLQSPLARSAALRVDVAEHGLPIASWSRWDQTAKRMWSTSPSSTT